MDCFNYQSTKSDNTLIISLITKMGQSKIIQISHREPTIYGYEKLSQLLTIHISHLNSIFTNHHNVSKRVKHCLKLSFLLRANPKKNFFH